MALAGGYIQNQRNQIPTKRFTKDYQQTDSMRIIEAKDRRYKRI